MKNHMIFKLSFSIKLVSRLISIFYLKTSFLKMYACNMKRPIHNIHGEDKRKQTHFNK